MLQVAKHQHGYTLILILLLMHFFILFNLLQWELFRSQLINIKNHWSINYEATLSEMVVKKIEKNLANHNNNCMISSLSSFELKQQSINFWQQKGCKVIINNLNFWYLIEKFTHDACAFITNKSHPGIGYYKISVKRPKVASILQIITSIPKHTKLPCYGPLHKRLQGRQSWREF